MSRYNRGASLYVRNLRSDTTLRTVFLKYGPIKDIYVPLDYHTKEVRGFAYVQYQDYKDAEDALYELKHVVVNDRELEIEFAQGDRKTPWEMRTKDPRISRYDDERNKRRSKHRRHHSRSYSRSYSRSGDSEDDYSSSGSYSRTPSPHYNKSSSHHRKNYDKRHSRHHRRHRSRDPRSRTRSPHFTNGADKSYPAPPRHNKNSRSKS